LVGNIGQHVCMHAHAHTNINVCGIFQNSQLSQKAGVVIAKHH